jgi:hypothetical protein
MRKPDFLPEKNSFRVSGKIRVDIPGDVMRWIYLDLCLKDILSRSQV